VNNVATLYSASQIPGPLTSVFYLQHWNNRTQLLIWY